MEQKPIGWIHDFSLAQPNIKDNTADVDRLFDMIKKSYGIQSLTTDLPLIKKIPTILRQSFYHVTCAVFEYDSQGILLDVWDSKAHQPVLGVAIDLGTTSVTVRIIHLNNGLHCAQKSFTNPQVSYGADILSRIHYSNQPEGLTQLSQCIIQSINDAIQILCSENQLDVSSIYLFSLAGNTAMTHLLLGLNPQWIIREPYIPVMNKPGLMRANDIGFISNPSAHILIFPNIGSYFGGDLIAGILYSGMYHAEQPCILVDVGTNAEVVIGNQEWLLACAGAAGPALESGVTDIGMPAGPGAIDSMTYNIQTDSISYHTIDNLNPIGICGSGMIDLAAVLFQSGRIDIRGKFVPSKCGNLLNSLNGMPVYQVVPANQSGTTVALTISQADIDSLIRSKAAMYTILTTITEAIGLSVNDLPIFYIAGTFGTYINPKSAITIGMIPDLDISRFKTLGNSSLEGATLALVSPHDVRDILAIRDKITYLELNVNQTFMNRFSAAKFLPHTDKTLFPSVISNQ